MRKPRKNKARTHGQAVALRRRKSPKIAAPRITCATFCDMFNIQPLSPYDDRQKGG
jgi:hypothetical protein